MADTNARDWLSVAEAAQLLGVSRTTVWRWIRAGQLPAYRVGPRTLRVERQAVDALGGPARHLEETTGFLTDEEADAMIADIYRGRDESLAAEIERDRERWWLHDNGRLEREPDEASHNSRDVLPESSTAAASEEWRLTPVDKEHAARKRAELFRGYDSRRAIAAIHEATGSWASLDRQSDAAHDNDDWRLTPVDKELAARKRAELFKDYDPEKVIAAIYEAAGSWADIDADQLIADIYRWRDEGTRPMDES